MTVLVLSCAAAFLCGSLPTGYLFGKWFFKTDIRTQGSGNTGATNALRVLGKKAGAWVFLIDFLKGFLPVLAYKIAVGGDGVFWAALAAVLGHCFTPWLGFKGGKGIATGAGSLAATGFVGFYLAALPGWIVVFAFTRIVSISSLFAILMIVPPAVVSYQRGLLGLGALVPIFLMAALTVWTHRENIARIKRGEEKRIG